MPKVCSVLVVAVEGRNAKLNIGTGISFNFQSLSKIRYGFDKRLFVKHLEQRQDGSY